MKKLSKLFVLILAVVLLFSSCKKEKSPVLNLIPGDATAFMMVDLPRLANKIKFEEFDQSKTYNTLLPMAMEEDKAMAEILSSFIEDPAITGFNTEEKMYGFFMKTDKGEDIFSLIFSLKDQAVFEQFMSDFLQKSEAEFEKNSSSSFDYFYMEDEELIAAYDEQRLMWFVTEQFTKEEALAQLEIYFQQGSAESISSVSDFQAFMKDAQDINVWISSDKLIQSGRFFEEFKRNFGLIPEGNYLHAYADFGADEISISSKMNVNEEMKGMMEEQLFFRDKIERRTLEKIDANEVLALYTLALDPAKLMSYMEKNNALGSFKRFANEAGIDFNELVNSFTGDVAFVFTGVEPYEVEKSVYNYEKMDLETKMVTSYKPIFTVSLGLTDDNISDEMISSMEEKFIQMEGYYQMDADNFSFYFVVSDNCLLISTNEQGIINVRDGKVNTAWLKNEDFINDPADNMMFFYVNTNYDNYNQDMQGWVDNEKGYLDKEVFNEIISKLDYVTAAGNNEEGKFILKLRNTDHNSLYTLFKLIDDNLENMMH